jgi:hypothetical protein
VRISPLEVTRALMVLGRAERLSREHREKNREQRAEDLIGADVALDGLTCSLCMYVGGVLWVWLCE